MMRMSPLVPLACLALALPLAADSSGPARQASPPAVQQAGAPGAPATSPPVQAGPAASPAPQTADAGWITLFDGKTLQGWRGYRRPDASSTRWSVKDGLLTLPARDGQDARGTRDIITTGTFDRFDLEFEWRVSPGGNSGVKYFVLEDRDSAIGHEYQIIDDEQHADAKIGRHRQTAAFYDVLAPSGPTDVRPLKPAGEWNTGRVRVAPGQTVPGSTRVEHYLNGVRVLAYDLDSPELRAAIAKSKFHDVERFGTLQKGHILLQDHSDQVWYRRVRIRPLPGS